MTVFSDDVVKNLSAPLLRENVKSRQQAGRRLSYVEGWHVIAEANRIFGFDAWNRETVDIRVVAERERKIGQQLKDGWGVSYVAKIRVTIAGVVREGVGAGHGIDVDLGLAHESAIKEAETDAFKRAMMSFGNPFGLALYDKEQANVADSAPSEVTALLSAAERTLELAAKEGLASLKSAWINLDPDVRQAFGGVAPLRFKDIAVEHDRRAAA